MYVIPFTENPSIWDAVLFIHQGESHRIHARILFRVLVLNAKLKSFRGKAITPTRS